MTNSPKPFFKTHLRDIQDLHILVLGDVMLDVFTYGRVERLSPEAPVPVVLVEREHRQLGGAANVAANISSFGAQATLLGRRGPDGAGSEIEVLLKEQGICGELITANGIPTTEKRRYVADGRHVVRVDREEIRSITADEEDEIIESVTAVLTNCHAVVIADYAKGVVTPRLVDVLTKLAASQNLPLIVDTKPSNISYFKKVSLITPNEKEALEAADVDEVDVAGPILQKRLQSPVLVTQGSSGMTLFTEDAKHHLDARAKNIVDVSGAGDTVVAAVAVMLAAGSSLIDAIEFANDAAGMVVAKEGTATLSKEDWYEHEH